MAKLKVSTDLPLSPDQAWAKASDLADYDKWLSIHDGWRGDIPTELATGMTLDSVVSVKGLRNRVAWKLEKFDPPTLLKLKGNGKGGVKVGLILSVAGKGNGSILTLDIDLGGAPMFGPIGSGIARSLKGDIEKSLQTFTELYG